MVGARTRFDVQRTEEAAKESDPRGILQDDVKIQNPDDVNFKLIQF